MITLYKNQPQFKNIFEHPKYTEFISTYDYLQEYWNAPMYVRIRKQDGYKEVCSNIQIGDFFHCGSTWRMGIVRSKITHIQTSILPINQKYSPVGEGGNYLSYELGGDIGGHWYSQEHDTFVLNKHFIWLPTSDRLVFSGFTQEAENLRSLVSEITNELTS